MRPQTVMSGKESFTIPEFEVKRCDEEVRERGSRNLFALNEYGDTQTPFRTATAFTTDNRPTTTSFFGTRASTGVRMTRNTRYEGEEVKLYAKSFEQSESL